MKTNIKGLKLKTLTLLGLTVITTPFYGDEVDSYSMLIASKNLNSRQDFINLVQLCKKFRDIPLKLHYNPIPLEPELITIDFDRETKKVNIWKLFSNIQTVYIYGCESSDFLKKLESKLPETVTKIHCCEGVSWATWCDIPKRLKEKSDVWFVNERFEEINENNAYLKSAYNNKKVKKVVYTYAIDYTTWKKFQKNGEISHHLKILYFPN